jgi:NDP-sugar pyrophosphorylase family protein
MVMPDWLDLRFHWEEEPLGTAGALGIVPDLDETFIAMNGDVLTTLDYGGLFDYHHGHGGLLTIAMQRKRVQIELGVIQHDAGYVNGYVEKPILDYDISMGVYVYERRALEYLPDGVCQFPDLVLRLIEAGERVAAYVTDADWFDIGTLEEYERAAHAIAVAPERFGMGADGAAGHTAALRRRTGTPQRESAALHSTETWAQRLAATGGGS